MFDNLQTLCLYLTGNLEEFSIVSVSHVIQLLKLVFFSSVIVLSDLLEHPQLNLSLAVTTLKFLSKG